MAARKRKRIDVLVRNVPVLITIDNETYEITPALRKMLVKAKKIAPHSTFAELFRIYLHTGE